MCHATTPPRPARLDQFNQDFARRLETEARALQAVREELRAAADLSVILEKLEQRAHKLSGAAGIFGFQAVSEAAATLEEGVALRRAGEATPARTDTDLEALIACITSA
jgi:HPt (histidine-containing phosphotransfer) domain-containing protein